MAIFTSYLAIKDPIIDSSKFPLLLDTVDLSNYFSGITKDNSLIVKPRSNKLVVDVPDETPIESNNNISFEELIKKENLPVRITSSFRGHGAKTAQGKLSNHGKLDQYGNSMAYDIVPLNGDFEGLIKLMYSNLNVVNWFKSKGWGILEETTPKIMKKTKATGKHLHIGPDPGAIDMFNSRLAKAANGMKLPFTEYYAVKEPKVKPMLLLEDESPDLSEYFNYINSEGTPIVKPRSNKLIIDTPEQTEQTVVPENNENNVSNNDAVLFFINKGLNKNHAVGIVANLMQESGLNPKAVNPKSGAYGLAQWLGSRLKKLFNKYGKNPTYEQLLEFIWEELNVNEKPALNKLLDTKSFEEATNSFMKHFERPSAREMADSISARLKFAKTLYNG